MLSTAALPVSALAVPAVRPAARIPSIDALRGLNISITTTAKSDDECKALLAGFRFPFKN